MEKGKMVIFSAPSGAGKTTLVHHLLSVPELKLAFSVSAASRAKRPNEQDGVDYHFLSVSDFKKRIGDQQFVEWEEVYPDQFYGTLKAEVERVWASGKNVIFDVDVIGGINLKKHYGKKALAIFVQPPTIDTLEERLRGRSTEDEENLQKRLSKATQEMEKANQFDVILINDDLQKAKAEAENLIKGHIR